MPGTTQSLRSFVEVNPQSDFSIYNLPYGVFSWKERSQHICTAIGDFVFDLTEAAKAGVLKSDAFEPGTLNTFISKGSTVWSKARAEIQALLSADTPELRDDEDLKKRLLIPQAQVCLHLPIQIGDYTDFYSSKEHATNVGALFRDPENALLPNWKHLPIAYHGRASSVVVSGTDIRRPSGQVKVPDHETPLFKPTEKFDFELEIGWVIGKPNKLGNPVPVGEAEDHIFGMVLVNDWSARDIQAWEYQPLGPFLGKSFATSVSPWVVTMEALSSFRVSGPKQDIEPLPYLTRRENGAFDITLELSVTTKEGDSTVLTEGNSQTLYWDIAQQVAHHTSNGCPLKVGDLLASGTISGATPESLGSLLEITKNGSNPLKIQGDITRSFLEDGDTVTIKGYAQGDGYRVGFGELSGKVLPAQSKS